jgi:hypothetical protein
LLSFTAHPEYPPPLSSSIPCSILSDTTLTKIYCHSLF